ncbi:MAG TPA: glycoside hydrolase family 88 protein [Granulicella sp.]|jgi:unsaturated rhamnogalacturonyl hydrolase|nr:glycoside hydrolase family 88 protein [Granulicella sp.]
MIQRRTTASALCFCLALILPTTSYLEPVSAQQAAIASAAVDREAPGDAPDAPGPIAHDLSPDLKSANIRAVMKKVADWQLATAESNFNRQWTFAALYDGLFAASATTGDPRYRDAVLRFAEQQHWQLTETRFPHADDMALGQVYLDLYLSDPPAMRKPERIADTHAILDRLVDRPDDPNKDLWWWCDALFMAPPVLARMYVATGDRKYLATMDREWGITTQHLYDPAEKLYFRDSRFLTQKQANGRKLFWARGNGWVLGALVKVLEVLPADDPSRPEYIRQFREMCAAIAAIQGKDGLWRSGLLDPNAYDLPEISGSSFFVYAMAYGINEHILDRNHFQPVVARGWKGILSHVYADGRLGSIQPIDGQPGKFKPSASYVYGVGGFLLAGSEVDRLAKAKHLSR